MAGTFGALAWGLQHYRPAMPWAGVLANRVASEGHAAMLKNSMRAPADWLGALMRNDTFTLPERHLGLTVPGEVGDAMARLDAAADALAATPLGRMLPQDMAHWALRLPAGPQPASSPGKLLQGLTIAVARDAAFCFIYRANLNCLQELGAELVFFSPLKDSALPACDAVWLPGGYPELHANVLGANHALRASLAQHIAHNKPVWAECGGMMVLFETPRAMGIVARHCAHAKTPGRLRPASIAYARRTFARPYFSLLHLRQHCGGAPAYRTSRPGAQARRGRSLVLPWLGTSQLFPCLVSLQPGSYRSAIYRPRSLEL
jgi:cobyrinic acid a,c-diamide synthase